MISKVLSNYKILQNIFHLPLLASQGNSSVLSYNGRSHLYAYKIH